MKMSVTISRTGKMVAGAVLAGTVFSAGVIAQLHSIGGCESGVEVNMFLPPCEAPSDTISPLRINVISTSREVIQVVATTFVAH